MGAAGSVLSSSLCVCACDDESHGRRESAQQSPLLFHPPVGACGRSAHDLTSLKWSRSLITTLSHHNPPHSTSQPSSPLFSPFLRSPHFPRPSFPASAARSPSRMSPCRPTTATLYVKKPTSMGRRAKVMPDEAETRVL